MVMTENKVIDIVGCGKVNGKLIQRFLFPTEYIFLVMGKTVVLRPSVSKSECNPGMKKTEKELCHTAVEDPTKEAVAGRNRTKSVTMTETETLSSYLNQGRLDKFPHAKFLEITVCPNVMVALEEIHLHSPVHQIDKGREHTDIAFRHDMFVFIPEIPDVSEKIDSLRILRKGPEEINETAFAVGGIADLQA